MAHANIEQRRLEVNRLISLGQNYGMIAVKCSEQFNCDKSAINSDIRFLTGIVESKRRSGIYFLIHNKKVVYIGQTINYPHRLRQHKFSKVYDSHRFIPCQQDKLIHYESRLIRIFKPKYNLVKEINKQP